ncbi:MAG: DUF2339 domain-containing protein [Fimbriimonadaceae bacterium]|nr:DUF2339 domain-containing protein [Fimbriimonadaceae bacterium]
MNDDLNRDILNRLTRLEGRVSALEAGSTRQQAAAPVQAPPPMRGQSAPTPTPPPIIHPVAWDTDLATPARPPIGAMTAKQPQRAVQQSATTSAEDAELALGSKVLPWAGAGLVVLGISYLTGLAIQRGFFTPAMQFWGAILLCISFLGIGYWRDRKEESIGQLLLGVGSAGMYLTFAGGHLTFDLYPGELMVGLFVLHSAANLVFGSVRGSKAFVVIGMVGGLIASLTPLLKSGIETFDGWPMTLALHASVTAATCGICLRKRWDDVLTGCLYAAIPLLIPIALNIPTAGLNQALIFSAYGLSAAGLGNFRGAKAISVVGLLAMTFATVWRSSPPLNPNSEIWASLALHAVATATTIVLCVYKKWDDVFAGIGAVLVLALLPLVLDTRLGVHQGAFVTAGYGAALLGIGLWRSVTWVSLAGLGMCLLSVVVPMGNGFGDTMNWPFVLAMHTGATIVVVTITLWKRWSEAAIWMGVVLGILLFPILIGSSYGLLERGMIAQIYALALSLPFAWRLNLQKDEGYSAIYMLPACLLAGFGFLVSIGLPGSDLTGPVRLSLRWEAGAMLWVYSAVLATGTRLLAHAESRPWLYGSAGILALAVAPLAWHGSHLLVIYTGIAAALAAIALVQRSRILAALAWGELGLAVGVYVTRRLDMISRPDTSDGFIYSEQIHLVSLIALTVLVAFTSGLFDRRRAEGKPDTANSDLLSVVASCIGWFLTGNLSLLALQSIPENARLTISWAAVGLVLLPLGFIANRRAVRFASFSLLGLTLAKIVLLDLASLDLPIRIVILITLGVAILGLSYLFYLRPKHEGRTGSGGNGVTPTVIT